MAPLPFRPTPVLFFTGKGGVGKTSLACASAIALADAGARVLLVSTDPASNLDEVLGVHLSTRPTGVPGVTGLSALNVDPDAAASAYRERVVGPYRGVLPASAVARIEEQLSGGCTMEIAAFDEFTTLLSGARDAAAFDHVVFDTAPTGHTLRLLALPAAWTGFIDSNATGTSCLGPLAGLRGKLDVYRASLAALVDPEVTTIVLVTRPETTALDEASRTSAELAALGVRHQTLIVNGIFTAAGTDDPVAAALERRGRAALAQLPGRLGGLPRIDVPLRPSALAGSDSLRRLFTPVGPNDLDAAPPPARSWAPAGPLAGLVDTIERDGHGAVLTMGKGGVGKTTIAAAIAVELATRGHTVHLNTTDPAAHVAAAVGAAVPRLTVTRIDPAAETAAYRAEVLAAAAPSLDARGLALLEEDLRSPCTEEVAVFRAFARAVAEGEHGYVVLDTAPTGHTLLLLDAAEAYHREVARTESAAPAAVRHLLPRLRDARYTKILLVTLPEATPVHEAAALQDDLRRAGIEPFAWVVNQSFAGEHITDPVLRERGRREQTWLREVSEGLATRVAWVRWYPEPPVGPSRLLELAGGGAERHRDAVVAGEA